MNKNHTNYAVLTGDIVGSSRLQTKGHRDLLFEILKSSFTEIKQLFPDALHVPFGIYRGDGFQGVLSQPGVALEAALVIRAMLISQFETQKRSQALDARIAIGVGTINYLPDGRGSEGAGQAFDRSGRELDKMKKERRLLIRCGNDDLNREFDVACGLLDGLSDRWSREQAQAMHYHIKGKVGKFTQADTAGLLGISQPAFSLRLQSAAAWAVDEFIMRYKEKVQELEVPSTVENK